MLVYECALYKHDMFTSAANPKLDEAGGCYVFDAKMASEKSQDYSENCGANASAEEAEEGTDEVTSSGLDFVLQNRLEEVQGLDEKKQFQQWIKSLLKVLEKKNEDKDDAFKADFKAAAQAYFKKVVAVIKDCSFFASTESEAEDPRNCVIVHWNDDGVSAKCYAFRYGVIETKC